VLHEGRTTLRGQITLTGENTLAPAGAGRSSTGRPKRPARHRPGDALDAMPVKDFLWPVVAGRGNHHHVPVIIPERRHVATRSTSPHVASNRASCQRFDTMMAVTAARPRLKRDGLGENHREAVDLGLARMLARPERDVEGAVPSCDRPRLARRRAAQAKPAARLGSVMMCLTRDCVPAAHCKTVILKKYRQEI
jgi:hypothetical protein